ncbi:MAG TPA: glycosyl hydrolase 115 family protein [Bryobacteraceae bacterium]|nr:glycosyl hydrolase 115 family protein [Bryobacteraceae bacterium]
MKVSAALLFAAALLPSVVSARVVVNATTTIFIDSQEPGPLQKAAADLAADFGRVFGQRGRIVHSPSQTGPAVIWIALDHNVPQHVERPTGWEHLRVQAIRSPGLGSPARDAVVLTGSDMRGAIFAVYQFSQQFLGVDPLYWWTDHAPLRRTEVTVPDAFSLDESPTFHYRGWFLNDEDLFTGWKPGITDGTGISLALWDHVFEAILRLKGNMVVPGTWIFPYEPQIQAAGERGLVVTQHHVNTLGLDTYRWPQNKPMSYLSDPQTLISAWTKSASEYPKGLEILWSVGFRGQNDNPFWQNDKNAPSTNAGRAQVILDAVHKQMEIVRSNHSNPEFFLNAWQEAARFIHEGVLRPPEGVTLVWPDNGHGILQDQGELASGEGQYYHTAMYDYVSNHYSEMVPLERIQRELGRAAKVGATRWLLVNTSNVRPVVMTTRAVMELAWNPKPWIAPNSTESHDYLERWSREEFGERAAPAIAAYYKAYFAAPGRYGTAEDATMADNFYHTAARGLVLAAIEGNNRSLARLHGIRVTNLESLAAALSEDCQAADARWKQARLLAEKARPLVPKDRLDFFQANILTQVDLQLHFNRMVLKLAQMIQASDNNDKLARLREAIGECEKGAAAMHAAEYGKWKGFYSDGDWLLDTPLTLKVMRTYLDKLEGRPVSQNVVIRAEDGGFAYHMITAYQGTQTVRF